MSVISTAKKVGLDVVGVANCFVFAGMCLAETAAVNTARGVGRIVSGKDGADFAQDFIEDHSPLNKMFN